MADVYVWQRARWPALDWDRAKVSRALGAARLAQGRLLGKVSSLGFDLTLSERVRVLTEEAIRTSSIEGEVLDPGAVRSSVARRLGLKLAETRRVPRQVDGLVDVLLDATGRQEDVLDIGRLKSWHGALFPTGRSGLHEIAVGEFRPSGTPMQVVSGPVGHEWVHFEAPPAERLEGELDRFLRWFGESQGDEDGLFRAAVSHFWFVTIHPFEDGNGRLARAVGEMALAQDEGQSDRFYSLSVQIEQERDAYYRVLESAQRGEGDLTDWIEWFLRCLDRAIRRSETQVEVALAQARFWRLHAGQPLNERQIKLLRRVLEEPPGGFEGGLTTRKVARLTRVSRATAQRDLAELLAKGVLAVNEGGGRSTSYRLVGYEGTAPGLISPPTAPTKSSSPK